MIRRGAAIIILGIMLIPSLLWAGPAIPGFYGGVAALPPIPANTVPVPLPGGIVYGVNPIPTPAPGANQMTIYQTQPKAVIDWDKFNIGSNSSVYFNQQGNTSWAALNRIWDANPSQIYGSLTSDGHVYLINRNGIFFGPGSQVNVHTLIASSLNVSIDNFLNALAPPSTLAFNTSQGTMNSLPPAFLPGYWYAAGQQDTFYSLAPGQTPGVVTNAGTITTDNLGSVFLIGPRVENSGTILSPMGQIGLVAGVDLELDAPQSTAGNSTIYPGGESRTALMVKMHTMPPPGSTASNLAGGYLAADTGLVGMYGDIVNQDGVIRSVTAVQRGAHVELFASDQITTGVGSQILLPVDTSSTVYDPSLITARSDVTFLGLDPITPATPTVYPNLIVHQGSIVAPGALVTMNAVNRVYLALGSLIDVSGLWLDEPAEAGLLQVQLNTVNLRDNFSQKEGVLQGATIAMSQLAGSAIGDVSGAFTTQGTTAAERHTAGGTVNITVTGSGTGTGDIVMMQGAAVNFSGGGITYGSGALDTTMLVSGTNIYNIAMANPNLTYDALLNVQKFTNTHFGITDEYDGIYYGGASPVMKRVPAYTVGANAGTFSLQAGTIVLDGTLLGLAFNGLQQTDAANPSNGTGNQSVAGYAEALGGTLNIGNTVKAAGNSGDTGDAANFITGEIVVSPQASPVLPATFRPTDSLPSPQTVLSAATLSNAGLSTLSVAANTTITVQKGAQITLNPGGTFNAWARRIVDDGGITALGGNINLKIQTNATTNWDIQGGTANDPTKPISAQNPNNPNYIPLDEMIYIGPDASLVARGERIDNTLAAASGTGITTPGYLNGGSINILDQTITGQGVAVMPGALLDVSGGWQISPSGKVTGGTRAAWLSRDLRSQ